MTMRPEFVETIPKDLEPGVLYISIRFTTIIHGCVCGCGNRVVTPLRPNRWRMLFDGRTVSLYPSIGNWSFPCQSHYWIRENEIVWSERWSEAKIRRVRAERQSDRIVPIEQVERTLLAPAERKRQRRKRVSKDFNLGIPSEPVPCERQTHHEERS